MNASLKPGQTAKYNGELFTFDRKLPNGNWQLRSNGTGTVVTLTTEDIRQAYLARTLKFSGEAESFNSGAPLSDPYETIPLPFGEMEDKHREIAQERYAYIQAIETAHPSSFAPKQLRPIIRSVHRRLGNGHRLPHPGTVYRWLQRYKKNGRSISALVPRFDERGSKRCRTNAKVVEFVDQAISEVYLQREKNSYRETFMRVVAFVAKHNESVPPSMALPLPKYRFVIARIQQIPAEDRCIAREGYQRAWQKFRSVKGHWVTKSPLEFVQIDATLLDLFVLDDETFLPLGRPWLTACIDVYTRCILGLYVGFEPPSDLSIARCIKNAILPKDELMALYPNIKHPWLCHGIPVTIVVDNGFEYLSDAFEAMCLELGIRIQHCPRKRPTYKPHIERWFRTLNQGLIHTIKGTTFSNILERGDYNPEKHAIVTLSVLRKLIYTWICDVYHVSPHRTLKDTPDHMWRTGTQGLDIQLPAHPEHMDIITGKLDKRTLFHYGIDLEGLRYNSDSLKELRHVYGQSFPVTVRWNAEDLGHIYVLRPDRKGYFIVPALDQAYAAGLTLWQHEQIKRYADKHLDGSHDIESLAEAKRNLSEVVKQEFLLKKARSRKREARYLNKGEKGAMASAGVETSDRSPSRTAAPVQVLNTDRGHSSTKSSGLTHAARRRAPRGQTTIQFVERTIRTGGDL